MSRPVVRLCGHRAIPAVIATGLVHYPGVRCPSCAGRHFEIGRSTAECVRCGGALILTNPDPLKEGADA